MHAMRLALEWCFRWLEFTIIIIIIIMKIDNEKSNTSLSTPSPSFSQHQVPTGRED